MAPRAPALLLLLAGCEDPWLAMEPTRVCEDVGFAIAARTFDCLDDTDLAGRRFDRFEREYRCRVESLDEPIDRYYHCPVSIQAARCPAVRDLGEDLDAWLALSPACAIILEHRDGSRLPSLVEP